MPEETTYRKLMDERFDNQDEKLDKILTQTIKTNGRVNGLESARDRTIGALAVLVIVVVPILTWALYVLTTIDSKINNQTQMAVDKAFNRVDLKAAGN